MMYRDNTGTYIEASEFTEEFKKRFTHKNQKRQQALNMGREWVRYPTIKGKPNKNYMPETIEHYKDLGNGFVKVPIGISGFLKSKFKLIYASTPITHPRLSRSSYDYQTQAIDGLLARSCGFLNASTGSGKTQCICDIITRLSKNTLVVVQNLTQMAQMVSDINTILGVTPTQVSGKKPSKKQVESWYPYITVCSIDSRDKINPKDYGLILLDECDTYLGSDERREWIGSLSPEYMYGLTGTPHVNHMDDAVFELYYGPKTDLILLNETPNYLRVRTGFKYGEFDMNEMHEMKQALYSDSVRNQLIIDTYATYSKGRKGLIFTEHVEHAKVLQESLERKGIKTFLMIGEVKESEREQVRNEVKAYKGDCCIVGSVKIIGRGFDIPELSLAILTTAERFNANINQYMGRLVRKFEGKPKPLFIDIYDLHTPFLRRQSNSRFATYQKTFPDGVSLTK